MFFDKIRNKESGILLYGICPPKLMTPPEKVAEMAERSLNILCSLAIDGLIVYDVQDESARTDAERPFPFASALDPFEYATRYLQRLTIPQIIYRPAGKFSREELTEWLRGLKEHGFHPVFVGLPSPDHVVKTSLKEAYALWKEHHEDHSVIGAIMIPERHAVLKDEDVRILDKVDSGVSYFISQCIFNVGYTKAILHDLIIACKQQHRELPTMIFTLTTCGSVKTLEFMDWLGIHVPDDLQQDLINSDDFGARSVEIAVAIAKELTDYCLKNGVPFGFNIESVATRKEEVKASLELLAAVTVLLQEKGLR